MMDTYMFKNIWLSDVTLILRQLTKISKYFIIETI